MKHLSLISIVIILFFCSCEKKSPLSDRKLEDLRLIGAAFEISSSNEEYMYASGNLYDKDGYAIDNDSVKIKVNNVDLILGKIPGMGLNDYEYHTFNKIPVSDTYNFEIVLTNGKKHFLGSIKPITKINKNDIIYNEKGNLNEDCKISWQNLKEYNELEIYKSFSSLKPDSTNNYITSSTINIEKIKPKGEYIIPNSHYKKKDIPIDFIIFKFKLEKKGKINPEFIAGSEIVIKDEIEKQINFKRE